jgi:hypothetical protein
VINYSGQLGRWRYTPKLTFVDGFETTYILGLGFSPDSEWFAILLPSLGRIEIRSTSDLSCLRQIQNEFIFEDTCEMSLSQDGRCLVFDACKNYEERDEEEGVAWIDLQTEDVIFRTWSEMNYISLEEEAIFYTKQMKFSPDQKQLAVNEWHDCYFAVMHFFRICIINANS